MELKDAGAALLDALARFFAVMPTWMMVSVVAVVAIVDDGLGVRHQNLWDA